MNKIKDKKRSDTCGGNVFQAAKDSSKSKRNLDETCIVMACCRHNIVLCGVNIYVGETYRHIHFLMCYLYELGVQFFCYDVVCQFWPWAQKVGEKMPDFRKIAQNMKPFLSRMHALAHVWYCYVRTFKTIYIFSSFIYDICMLNTDFVGRTLDERRRSYYSRRT